MLKSNPFRSILAVAVVLTLGAMPAAAANFSSATTSLPPTKSSGPSPQEAVTITHSVSQSIVSGNSVSCNAGGLHTNNSYFRSFNLPSFGINAPFDVTSLSMGIEQALGAGGSQPASIRYYTDTNTNVADGGLTLLSTVPIVVPDASLAVLNFPGGPLGVPVGSNLVVEFFTPDGQAAGNSLFVGSNSLGQTGPGWIAAADCGIPNPLTLASIGFPNMHMVMNVSGNLVPEPASMGVCGMALLALGCIRRRFTA